VNRAKGRPRLDDDGPRTIKRSFTITEETLRTLFALGDGNASEGLRRAAEAAMGREGACPKCGTTELLWGIVGAAGAVRDNPGNGASGHYCVIAYFTRAPNLVPHDCLTHH
jgi:hypothetical protein